MKKINYTLLQARKDLPYRKKTDNKTHGGKCLIAAGSSGQWGAAILCAQACARIGAGYTYLLDPQKKFPTLQFPDFLLKFNQKEFSVFQAFAVGPGLKNFASTRNLIRKLSSSRARSVVLDAEALNVLARLKKPFALPPTWILTPHEGEMARLLGTSSAQVKADREKAAILLQRKFGCVIVLKGAPTLIADGKSLFKIKSGNSSLAKAGTGDVLTGIIAGLLSQGLSSVQAACLGAFIHGFTADLWLKNRRDHLSLLASDVVNGLASSLFQIRKGR